VFDTLLIANRGEIAVRIQRAARSLGLKVVQAHSGADAEADYVLAADQAICIGPAPSVRSYLNEEALLAAAWATGAGAIHPGYGFLSENAGFSRRVEEAGLAFVGPPAECIATMGDKIRAKANMRAAGVPCVPGYEGELASDEAAMKALHDIGLPAIIKAAGGGGGRGMRIVTDSGDLTTAIKLTREEAQQAFGNPAVYIERYLDHPRHVEIQVLCDQQGNCFWLGARDCSTQRRHQKPIEETPAIGIADDLLAEVGQRCADACRSMGYVGAGTFEFLYQEGEFFFIEMNTRLQVEHTVTEMVTGIDLVQAQIRIAQGETLDLAQETILQQGHSIECRITAENPVTFQPSAGRIRLWQMPGGPGLRVDTHITTGAMVSPYYDSMIAKLISHGRDREEAIARMIGGLRQFVVRGIETNIPTLLKILATEAFRAGGADIHFLERWLRAE
jgi:acetyl-CoA carboxylase, biotin carboxylase subunit